MLAREHLAQLRGDPLFAYAGEEEVACLVQRRFTAVDEKRRRCDGGGVDLACARDAGADGVDVRTRLQPAALENRLARARARADDVGLAEHLLRRAAVTAGPCPDLR